MSVTNGYRVELRLREAAPGSAEYALEVRSAGGASTGCARYAHGQIDVELDEPQAAVEDFIRGLMRSAHRASTAPDSTGWPRRITRWHRATRQRP